VRGSIVEYLAEREGTTRGQCLERLAACADERGVRSEEAARYRAVLRERPGALEDARREYDQARAAEEAARRVLERSGIPGGAIDEARFGRSRSGEDAMKLISEPRTLWASRYRPSDEALVLVERAIDAIAYERAHGKQGVCYIATGSNPDADQLKRLGHILAEVPDRISVVLAFGGDRAGCKLAAEVQALAPMMGMERRAPSFGARWADQMQLEARHVLSVQRVNGGLSR
jgi:hypothetical protein